MTVTITIYDRTKTEMIARIIIKSNPTIIYPEQNTTFIIQDLDPLKTSVEISTERSSVSSETKTGE